MNDDLKTIKKNYGKNFAHLCRELFPSLLEKEGLLPKILLSNIYPTHSLYDDIINNYYQEDFKNYIYSFFDVEKKDIEIRKTVKDLLSEAGYNFYECHSEEDIQAFKKYYAKGEELCTFNGNRLNRCHVFWAIKKDVDNIKKEDYSHPTRQDKYGTSVIRLRSERNSRMYWEEWWWKRERSTFPETVYREFPEDSDQGWQIGQAETKWPPETAV